MPPVPSTNLTFNIPVFRNGVKGSSVDEQKQGKLPDHESKVVHPPAAQENQTNDPRCAQVVTSHHWYDSAVQAHVKVSKPHGTQIQTWPSRTFEINPSDPQLGSLPSRKPIPKPGSPTAPMPRLASPVASRRPGQQVI
ncbi:hypothetical protein MTO96_006870 [Rhipicephalus appendiculatus]